MADLDLATILADGEYLRRVGDTLVGDIPASGGTPEDVVDTVAAALVDGTGIDIVYDDTGNTITVNSTVAGGSTILAGTSQPDPTVGAVGDYYEDTVNGILYGPKGSTGWGTAQRFTVPLDPNIGGGNYERGVRIQFVRHGRITKIRYKRLAGSANDLRLRVWDDVTQVKLLDAAENPAGSGLSGAFEITLGTPLPIAAGDVRIFSIGSAGSVPYYSVNAQAVANTADMAFLGYRTNDAAANTFPGPATTAVSVYVEPTFEANEAWPVTVRMIAGYQTTSAATRRTVTPMTGTARTGSLSDAGSYLRFTGTNPTYTVPPNSAVAFPVGTQIDGIGTATAMTLVQGSGVTITKARTLVTVGAGSGWTLIKTATDAWDLHGDCV